MFDSVRAEDVGIWL